MSSLQVGSCCLLYFTTDSRCPGAANGIGRAAALCFAKFGLEYHVDINAPPSDIASSAKVVIGDLDMVRAEQVVAEIKAMGRFVLLSHTVDRAIE